MLQAWLGSRAPASSSTWQVAVSFNPAVSLVTCARLHARSWLSRMCADYPCHGCQYHDYVRPLAAVLAPLSCWPKRVSLGRGGEGKGALKALFKAAALRRQMIALQGPDDDVADLYPQARTPLTCCAVLSHLEANDS